LFITIGITLLTIQTRFDFANWWLLLVLLGDFSFFKISIKKYFLINFIFLVLSLVGFGIGCGVAAAVNNAYILQAVYGGICAIIMALFLGIDTQMIMGGRTIQFNPEEYVNAALQLYLVIIFWFVLLNFFKIFYFFRIFV
jgi:hypothetical protein